MTFMLSACARASTFSPEAMHRDQDARRLPVSACASQGTKTMGKRPNVYLRGLAGVELHCIVPLKSADSAHLSYGCGLHPDAEAVEVTVVNNHGLIGCF